MCYNHRKGVLGIEIEEINMYNTVVNETAKLVSDIPKVFWKYYDLYRRNQISLEEFSIKADLTKDEILYYLSAL